MDNRVYTGLCIGGPDDGLVKTANDNVRVGYKINHAEVYGYGAAPPSLGDAILERTFYRFEAWQAPTKMDPSNRDDDWEVFGVWVPVEMLGADAMRRVIEVYAKATTMTIADIQATMERASGGANGTGSVLP